MPWHYGHAAKKVTWLYAHGVTELPSLVWGVTPDTEVAAVLGVGASRPSRRAPALVSWCGNHVSSGEDRPRLSKRAASATPPAFRDLLLSIARSVRR